MCSVHGLLIMALQTRCSLGWNSSHWPFQTFVDLVCQARLLRWARGLPLFLRHGLPKVHEAQGTVQGLVLNVALKLEKNDMSNLTVEYKVLYISIAWFRGFFVRCWREA